MEGSGRFSCCRCRRQLGNLRLVWAAATVSIPFFSSMYLPEAIFLFLLPRDASPSPLPLLGPTSSITLPPGCRLLTRSCRLCCGLPWALPYLLVFISQLGTQFRTQYPTPNST
ncbi:hypothetical protein CONLIGDRAFT_361353 [Coniochaeta ligniaria NRRL 30616]|uniref:Uncharacterized protein n=1 Tax=Coniochaeta ligniaria NRRL 30616 TaxID=1408157 RepID=A0A1J7JLT0_9PEZI|nr:hypothetical protein CONLIGDRAFT_361353 [Coniochaeta ligniaria NRRL 30616]